MIKIVINRCHGGFGLSEKASRMLKKATGKDQYSVKRNNRELVKIVEKLGEAANGAYAKLAVVKIPSGVKWKIEEYDGSEWVAEEHRTWA